MKKYNLATLVITVIASAIWFTACQDEDVDGLIRPTTYSQGTTGKPGTGGTVSIGNGLYGISKVDWTKEWWKYVMGFDCANNPLNQTGVSTAPKQIGQVVYLVPGFGTTTSVEITSNQVLLVPIINILSEYPCTGSGKPKPGQTIEQFLKNKADVAIDQATNIKVDFDFERIEITEKNRIPTNLFYFKGNRDLTRCIDPCVTGQIQSAVSDGYWLFFENLTPGKHILTIHAVILATGEVVDATFKILVN